MKRPLLPHQVGAMGFEVYLLVRANDLGEEGQQLVISFREYVKHNGFENLVQHQIEYVMRIIGYRHLVYEDIHKVFSLCDEIEGLRQLGLEVDDRIYTTYQETLRGWFKKERRKAQLVAQDNVEGWKKEWWWYSENLSTAQG
jgi:hypothetical protein